MARPTFTVVCPSRRAVMQSALAIGGVVALPSVLTACTSDDGGETSTSTPAAVKGARVPVADVPVGSAVITTVNDVPLVLAQPEAGSFVAFSAICTHQGAVVAAKDRLIVRCPAHGSEFDAGDGGAATEQPATEPLPQIPVSNNGAEIVLG